MVNDVSGQRIKKDILSNKDVNSARNTVRKVVNVRIIYFSLHRKIVPWS